MMEVLLCDVILTNRQRREPLTHFQYYTLFAPSGPSGVAELGVMDSDEEYLYECDSGNESSGDDVGLDFDIEGEAESGSSKYRDTEDYPYEVLSTEDITRHMIDCIKEVNSVVNVSM